MFNNKTVLLLGAGASCHLGYPTGYELIQKIKEDIQHGFIGDPVKIVKYKFLKMISSLH